MFRSIRIGGAKAQRLTKYINSASFTTSTNAAISIVEEAARNLKKTVLELGGSDPFIVLQSAKVPKAVENVVYSRIQNNWHNCIASKHLIVHENAFNEFKEKYSKHFTEAKMGGSAEQRYIPWASIFI